MSIIRKYWSSMGWKSVRIPHPPDGICKVVPVRILWLPYEFGSSPLADMSNWETATADSFFNTHHRRIEEVLLGDRIRVWVPGDPPCSTRYSWSNHVLNYAPSPRSTQGHGAEGVACLWDDWGAQGGLSRGFILADLFLLKTLRTETAAACWGLPAAASTLVKNR